MLTKEQQAVINAVPDQATYVFESFDPRVREMAYRVIDDLQRGLPHAIVRFIGSASLGIVGSNKADIFIIANQDAGIARQMLEGLFGASRSGAISPDELVWEASRNGYLIIIHAFPCMNTVAQNYLDANHLLEARGDLRSQYEMLKHSMRGAPLKEFLTKKYEFFNALVSPSA